VPVKIKNSNCSYRIQYSLDFCDTVMSGFLDVYPSDFSVKRVLVISESSVFNKNITALALHNYLAHHRHVS
jgi:hypothetical protein